MSELVVPANLATLLNAAPSGNATRTRNNPVTRAPAPQGAPPQNAAPFQFAGYPGVVINPAGNGGPGSTNSSTAYELFQKFSRMGLAHTDLYVEGSRCVFRVVAMPLNKELGEIRRKNSYLLETGATVSPSTAGGAKSFNEWLTQCDAKLVKKFDRNVKAAQDPNKGSNAQRTLRRLQNLPRMTKALFNGFMSTGKLA